MSKEHSVIVVPGLSDETKKLVRATNHWRNHGLEPIVHAVGWRNEETDFRPKLERLVSMIDDLTDKGDTVSLVGTSAGGSAVVNAFFERKEKIHKIVNVCGRLTVGPQTGFRSFEAKSATSPPFAESVRLSEKNISQLSARDKQKIMTVRAMFGDELVPPVTTIVEGAYNTRIPTIEHALSIRAALTVLSKPIIIFLKKK